MRSTEPRPSVGAVGPERERERERGAALPRVLGVNCVYHESAAALVEGGSVIAAVEEERLTRVKHAKPARFDNPDELPWGAIEYVLRRGGVDDPSTLDGVAIGFLPGLRGRTIGVEPPGAIDLASGWGTEAGEQSFDALVRAIPARLAERLGIDPERVRFLPHHLAHAAASYYTAGLAEAALLVLDGVGEAATGWLGRGRGATIERLEALHYPHSIGLVWERVALWLGLGPYDAAKVMGLAAYGDGAPYADGLARLLHVAEDPIASARPFTVDATLARLRAADVRGLEELFGPRRAADEPIVGPRFAGVASALQAATERAVLACAERLRARTGPLPALCVSGGVALNCVANAALERAALYPRLHALGACHDAGTAVGAALALALEIAPRAHRTSGPPESCHLGPTIDAAEADEVLRQSGLAYERVEEPHAVAAQALARGAIVGWAEGALELGPRALGRRSVLADPRDPAMRERLNRVVKKRESFRPFGASILEEALADWFDAPAGDGARWMRRLMMLAYPVRLERRAAIPAVVHADGTCRLQTVGREEVPYRLVLERFFAETGVPLLLNTSFNDREPIVCTARDAVATAHGSGMDLLVLGPFVARLR